MAISKLDFNR